MTVGKISAIDFEEIWLGSPKRKQRQMLGCLAQVTAGRTTAGYASLAQDSELVPDSALKLFNTSLMTLV